MQGFIDRDLRFHTGQLQMLMPQSPQPTDESSFGSLFDQHARAIYAHIVTLVPSRHDADEVFQETSVTIWKKLEHYQPGTDFRAWACRIAYHKVLKLRERKGRTARLFSDGMLERIDEELIVMSDKLDARREALALCREKLPRGDRQMLDRYYGGTVGVKDLAAARGCSIHKVYRALRRIHEALFACVTKALLEIDHA